MSLSEKQSSVRSGSDVSSSVSVKSDRSKDDGPNFSEKTPPSVKSVRSGSHVSSSVSVKSDRSKDDGPNFNEKIPPSANRLQWETLDSDFHPRRNRNNFKDKLLDVFQDLESKIIKFLKDELEKFKKILQKENTQNFVKDFNDNRCSIKEAALDLTLHYLRDMKQDEAADTLEDELVFIHHLKYGLKKKYQCVFEGIAKQGDSTLLNNIYTDLYITQGGSERVNTEHEVRQIEVASRRHQSQEIPIECTKMFEAPEQDKEIRTVLTKGVAGIGKTISVQKFVLDWAEGKENQDISFIFPLPFREMNLKEIEKSSLMDLITQFFPETKGLNLTRRKNFKVLFILDGLDECRLPLKFDGNETWRDVSSPASLDVILTNLMKGNLLPSALIWITTRPAAASKIPPDCIDRVTEIRGFNDAQKEEYFRKRFTDEKMTNVIFDHVKKSKSLFIMCHIPVFCWISATVLQNILEEKINNDLKNSHADETSITLQESNTEDTPKTLTQMYAHFLRFQIQQSRRKYDGEYRPDVSLDKDTILSLGKLAFQQLERSNVIFYESDLEACGIDVYKASVCSGMCTQIFKEETGITLGTMYCFVHLSIQEFIAALYAHLFLDINKKSVFVQESTEQEYKNETMIDVLKTAVDKALKSDNGHLDLFLRFFLSLSLQSNRRLLQGLLTQQDGYDQSKKEIVQYIKQKLEGNLSPERSINLFYCLNELNDQTLVKEIQTQLREGSLSFADLSPAQWSALVFVLLTSEKELEEFELQKFKKSDECLIRLLAVIKTSKRALLNDSNLTDRSCSALATILGSDTELIELNMNNNNLQDSGLKLLCTGLKNIKCKLERLKLSDCSITEEGYKALASALRSNPSHLIELDLTGNDPGQSGVKELTDLLQDGRCTYIRFLKSPAAEEACEYLTEVLGKSPFLLTELDLSEDKLGDLDGEKKKEHLALLMDSHSKLETIKLNNCVLTEKSCSVLATVLSSKTILKELNLNNSRLLDSGVKQISEGLKNPVCELKILKLSDCSITEEGYKALASALRSNPSHLIELDLTGNDPGQSGVKELTDLLQDPNCQLKTIRFLKSPAAEEVCEYLTEVLGKSPLLLTELDLSEDKLGALDGEKLSALLMDSHCKLETIKLNNCELTEKSCSVLATVLSSKTILKELNLNNSRLLNLGVKQICEGLKNPVCELKILKLSDCSITEEGYKALASALRSNPSHLIELDLTGNYPGQSGVKELSDLLQDQNCQLKLRFLSPAADEACEYVRGIVGKNPLLLRELNLSERELGDTGVNQIAALLKDKHCKLNTLILCRCSIKEKQCFILTSSLKSNLSHLRELNLSGNKLGDSGGKHLCDVLKDSHSKLERLRLTCCEMTNEGCSAVTSALKSNPSHLRELDLSGNKLGDSGVKHLSDVLKDSHCKLERLRLTCCKMTNEGCSAVTSALKLNPSHLRELDLSGNKLGDSEVKHLHDVLKDSHSKLERLRLTCCEMTNEGCSAVTSALKSHLRELDLSGNKLGDSGVNNLSVLLINTQCKLEKLHLCECSITEKQCLILTSALSINPSHLRELDLSGNEIKNTVCYILKDSRCKLERLSLNNCGITDVSLTQSLTNTKVLQFLKELDLRNNNIGDSKEQLRDVLRDSNCKLRLDSEMTAIPALLGGVAAAALAVFRIFR
ncbi:NACHT, LRR and PYD domains-containing protein 3-like isoform X8 [Ctenopharyngodon idella]|uniref:NACHT, LRR and PYD domains-containing protein 3-like isoform X8 n=1 Tax=Ctenopharyngodon idella TaxID=7959 RepID=UPI0022307F1E|nr:NACHT, LRR and PYD domains-containing protein 3-like isoform X8 [Ctenopharyngodon idella]